jgi:uncharacterized protein
MQMERSGGGDRGRGRVLDRAGRTLGGLALAIGVVASTVVVCQTVIRVKADKRDYSVQVTGSAKRTVPADRATWSGTLSVRVERASDGHRLLEQAREGLAAFLVARGVPAADVRFSAAQVDSVERRDRDKLNTTTVGYVVTQTVVVETTQREPVLRATAAASELIAAAGIEGGQFVWRPGDVRYVYTRLDELKQDVLAEAMRNARQRAAAIAGAAGAHLGALRQVDFGDIQVRSPASQARYSDDESSPVKDLIADVRVLYHVR